MDLHVKRFLVSYQGKRYGPGSVIYNVPSEIANKLLSESNGTIEALPQRDDDIIDDNEDIVSVNDDNDTNASIGLPSIDPKKTVK